MYTRKPYQHTIKAYISVVGLPVVIILMLASGDCFGVKNSIVGKIEAISRNAIVQHIELLGDVLHGAVSDPDTDWEADVGVGVGAQNALGSLNAEPVTATIVWRVSNIKNGLAVVGEVLHRFGRFRVVRIVAPFVELLHCIGVAPAGRSGFENVGILVANGNNARGLIACFGINVLSAKSRPARMVVHDRGTVIQGEVSANGGGSVGLAGQIAGAVEKLVAVDVEADDGFVVAGTDILRDFIEGIAVVDVVNLNTVRILNDFVDIELLIGGSSKAGGRRVQHSHDQKETEELRKTAVNKSRHEMHLHIF